MSGKNANFKFNVCSFTLRSSYGGKGRCIERLVGKLEGKIQLGRPRCRWADNTKMNLQKMGWGCMDWIHLAQDRDRWQTFVNAEKNRLVP